MEEKYDVFRQLMPFYFLKGKTLYKRQKVMYRLWKSESSEVENLI